MRELAEWIRKEILEIEIMVQPTCLNQTSTGKEENTWNSKLRARVSYWWFTCMVYKQIIAPMGYALPVI